jgi:hypothetical protein
MREHRVDRVAARVARGDGDLDRGGRFARLHGAATPTTTTTPTTTPTTTTTTTPTTTTTTTTTPTSTHDPDYRERD